MRDDRELLRAAHARWMLLCEREPSCDSVDATSNTEAKGIYLTTTPAVLGSSEDAQLLVADSAAAGMHAKVWRDEKGDCYIQVSERHVIAGLAPCRSIDAAIFGDTLIIGVG